MGADGILVERFEQGDDVLPLRAEGFDGIAAGDVIDIGLGVRGKFGVRRASTDHYRSLCHQFADNIHGETAVVPLPEQVGDQLLAD